MHPVMSSAWAKQGPILLARSHALVSFCRIGPVLCNHSQCNLRTESAIVDF